MESEWLIDRTNQRDRCCIKTFFSRNIIHASTSMMPNSIESASKSSGSFIIFKFAQNCPFHFGLVVLGFHKKLNSITHLFGGSGIACIDKFLQFVPEIKVQRVEVWTIRTLEINYYTLNPLDFHFWDKLNGFTMQSVPLPLSSE